MKSSTRRYWRALASAGSILFDTGELFGQVVDRHTTFEALATYYEAGAFLRQASPAGRNLFYVSLKMNYRF